MRKIRGSTYRGGNHDFVIEKGGIVAFPRLVAAKHHRTFKTRNLSSAVSGIDAMLGGGLARGTGTLFSGPPGTGKSSLALKFVVEAAKHSEKVAPYSHRQRLEMAPEISTRL